MVKLRNREVGRANADGRQLSVPAGAELRPCPTQVGGRNRDGLLGGPATEHLVSIGRLGCDAEDMKERDGSRRGGRRTEGFELVFGCRRDATQHGHAAAAPLADKVAEQREERVAGHRRGGYRRDIDEYLTAASFGGVQAGERGTTHDSCGNVDEVTVALSARA